jgi:glucose/arabinose dehydrogenase
MKRIATALIVLAPVLLLTGCTDPTLSVQTDYVTGLDSTWDIGFLPNGTMFFNERTGPVSVRLPNGAINTIVDPSDVRVGGEGGMLGLAVDPQFASNRFIYTCFSSNLGGPDNRLVRWKVNASFNGVTQRTDIVTGLPYNVASNGRHSGCRPRFGSDGFLYVGTGDAAIGTNAQSKTSLGGKILRVNRNGVGAPGNIGVRDPASGFDPRIFNWGHRNVQGIAFRPSDGMGFSVEHGPNRDDEVNRIVEGNFGWDPVPGYNESVPMTDTAKFPGAIGAVWSSGSPTIAPSGATFLTGEQWELWNGALALAVLKNTELRVLLLNGAGNVTGQKVALDLGVRLRQAVQGPDGNLYVATDAGGIWKVTPS